MLSVSLDDKAHDEIEDDSVRDDVEGVVELNVSLLVCWIGRAGLESLIGDWLLLLSWVLALVTTVNALFWDFTP